LGGAPEALEGFNVDPPKGRVIAVQFMGDLWHKEIPQSYRDCIFNRIRRCPESVFLLLTKRPERVTEDIPDNCWLGTSAHDNASLFAARDAMAKHCYRAKRWLSIEPALSPVEPIGFGLYDFIACGPEMVSGHETGDSSWIDAMTDWPKHYPGTSFYDKRRDWKIRQWPEAWKAVGKAIPGGLL
jgi:protein gp37